MTGVPSPNFVKLKTYVSNQPAVGDIAAAAGLIHLRMCACLQVHIQNRDPVRNAYSTSD